MKIRRDFSGPAPWDVWEYIYELEDKLEELGVEFDYKG